MAVSAVINNTKSTVRVSDATRERIFAAMAELRYQPHVTARSLRLQRTDTIGFYNGQGYIDLMDPFAPTIFLGLQSAAAAFSNHLLLYNGFHLQTEAVVRRKLLSSKADGVVIWPSPGDAPLIRALGETDKPVIQLVEDHPGVPCVATDDYACARLLAEHLADRGHGGVLYRRGIAPLRSEVARYRAFTDVARERGMRLISTTPADRFDLLTDYEQELLRGHAGPDGFTAVACWHDASAVQAMRFCGENGIRVPGDLALTGFDGFAWREFPEGFPLTTVVVDWREVAAKCVELLIARIRGQAVPDLTIVPGMLRIGATT